MATAVGWAPIIKSEKTADGTLRVTGKAADSSVDRDYQIADEAWLDKAMGAWYSEPDGGNVREQHDGKRAVGTAIEYRKGDDGGHYITAEIVDPVTVRKIERNVLKGFSWSARNARVQVDKAAAGGRIVDGQIYEVSVVDRPANPACQFTIAKADGPDGDGELELVDAPELVEVDKADVQDVGVIEKGDEPKFTPSDMAAILKSLNKTSLMESSGSAREVLQYAFDVARKVSFDPAQASVAASAQQTSHAPRVVVVVNKKLRGAAAQSAGPTLLLQKGIMVLDRDAVFPSERPGSASPDVFGITAKALTALGRASSAAELAVGSTTGPTDVEVSKGANNTTSSACPIVSLIDAGASEDTFDLVRVPVLDDPLVVKSAQASFLDLDGLVAVIDSALHDRESYPINKSISAAERKEMASKGIAMPNGDFPIPDEGHLRSAVGRLKKYTGDKGAAKKHIIKRARALDAIDLLPEDWNVAKANGVLAQVRSMVPGHDIAKAEDELGDITGGKAAIAAIARLIISEAESLAAGNMNELWDIRTLLDAACALQCFVDSETWEDYSMTETKADTAKSDDTPTAAAEEKPAEAPETPAAPATEPETEKTETVSAEETLTKTDLTDLLESTIAKVSEPYEERIAALEGQLAKVLETPRTDGPARTRTTTHTAVASKADELRSEIAYCAQQIRLTGGDLQKGYRQRLDDATDELHKLDGAAS